MPGNLTPSPDQFALLTAQLSACDATLAERENEVAHLRETIAALEHTLTVRTLEIEEIKLQLSVLRRMQFGRKSEKFERQIDALETRLEDLLAEEGEAEVDAPPAGALRTNTWTASKVVQDFVRIPSGSVFGRRQHGARTAQNS